jgi:hypothetical protein
MQFGGSKRARNCVALSLSNQVAGQESSRGAAAKSCAMRRLDMSSDGHSAPLCRHGQHVSGVQGMVPARKNKGSEGRGVWWWDDEGEMPTWLPLRGGKGRKKWEGGSKVKRAAGKLPLNQVQQRPGTGGKSGGKSAKIGRHVPVILETGESPNWGDILGWEKVSRKEHRERPLQGEVCKQCGN